MTATESVLEVTRSVCRIGYGFADVTVRVAIDATEPEIEAAILDEAGNYSYGERDAQYELATRPEASSERQAIDAFMGLLDCLSALGFSTDGEINGADAVDEIGDAYAVALQQIKGTQLEPFLIFSATEDGFWSKDMGWTAVESATHYFRQPVDLPIGSANDARPVRLTEALQISKQNS